MVSWDHLRLTRLELVDIGCVGLLTLYFGSEATIICGINGVGKTTILDALVSPFTNVFFPSVRRAGTENGHIYLSYTRNGQPNSSALVVTRQLPKQRNEHNPDHHPLNSYLIYFKSTRDILYESLDAITKDTPLGDLSPGLIRGLDVSDLKNWIAKRFMFSVQPNGLRPYERENYELLKRSFSVLDDTVSFSHVAADTFDVYVNTPDGIILFEQLSSGYRSICFIVLGIIQEVERRFLRLASGFPGVILIDEIDLHLHPTWQSAALVVLRRLFPSAQFIATTHSPHVVQAAAPHEVIALVRDDAGETAINELPITEYGFRGWTIEEILADVMGLRTTRSAEYESAVAAFEASLQSENADGAVAALRILLAMLHPRSPERKLLRLRAAEVAEPTDINPLK